MRARVALRERSLVDVIDLTVRFCVRHLRAFALVAAVVIVPGFVLSWGVAWRFGWVAGWIAAIALAALADVPFLVLASRLLFDDAVPLRTVLREALRVFPRLAAARLIQLVAWVVGVVFGGLGWIYVGPIVLFLGEVAVLERTGLRVALRRARLLAAAHFGTAILTTLLVVVMIGGGVMLADLAGRELLEQVLEVRAPASLWIAGGSWLGLLGGWAAVPLVATARFFVYIDCRTRSEGWDIQTRFAAMAARAKATAEAGEAA
jgi:hypothetical protein